MFIIPHISRLKIFGTLLLEQKNQSTLCSTAASALFTPRQSLFRGFPNLVDDLRNGFLDLAGHLLGGLLGLADRLVSLSFFS